jgi:acyl-CoA dehydrogenase
MLAAGPLTADVLAQLAAGIREVTREANHDPGAVDDLWLGLAEHGYLGAGVPEEFGGAGTTDPRLNLVMVEESARAGHTALALRLAARGDRHRERGSARSWVGRDRRALLPGLATAATVCAISGVLTDSYSVAPDGRSVTGGETAVVLGARAAAFLVAVGTDADRQIVIVDAAQAVTAPTQLLGAAGLAAADVTLAGVSGDSLGHDILGQIVVDRDLGLAAAALGLADRALSLADRYAGERRVFGRALADFDNTRVQLGRCRVQLSAARALYEATVAQHLHQQVPAWAATRCVLAAIDATVRAADVGLQVHGGYGYMHEYPISHVCADARLLALLSDPDGRRAAQADAASHTDGR